MHQLSQCTEAQVEKFISDVDLDEESNEELQDFSDSDEELMDQIFGPSIDIDSESENEEYT